MRRAGAGTRCGPPPRRNTCGSGAKAAAHRENGAGPRRGVAGGRRRVPFSSPRNVHGRPGATSSARSVNSLRSARSVCTVNPREFPRVPRRGPAGDGFPTSMNRFPSLCWPAEYRVNRDQLDERSDKRRVQPVGCPCWTTPPTLAARVGRATASARGRTSVRHVQADWPAGISPAQGAGEVEAGRQCPSRDLRPSIPLGRRHPARVNRTVTPLLTVTFRAARQEEGPCAWTATADGCCSRCCRAFP